MTLIPAIDRNVQPTIKRAASEETDKADAAAYKPAKKKKVNKPKVEATRRSSRLVEAPETKTEHVALPDDFSDANVQYGGKRNNTSLVQLKQLDMPEIPEKPEDDPNYDPDYRAPLPIRDTGNSGYGKLRFADTPHFTPNLTPEEIMRLGSFGGSYWRPFKSRILHKALEEQYSEFPQEWCKVRSNSYSCTCI